LLPRFFEQYPLRWREKRVLGQDAVGDATIPSGAPWSFYRNYSPGMLRLKDANIGSVAFKNAKVFNSIQVPIGFLAGAGATKDQLEEIVADESLALIDHYRIVRGGLYKGFGAASEVGDGNALAPIAGGSRGIG
jgi:hypothetical protein